MPDLEALIIRIEKELETKFRQELAPEMVFHNWEHTRAVAGSAREVARGSGFSDRDCQLAEIAGWFHDVGYLKIYEGHEAESIKIASAFLQKANLPEPDLAKVLGAIGATDLKAGPKNEFENILHDADMYHLASPDFFRLSDLLRAEWKMVRKHEYSDGEWLKSNLDFVRGVSYKTKFGRTVYEPERKKLENELFRRLSD